MAKSSSLNDPAPVLEANDRHTARHPLTFEISMHEGFTKRLALAALAYAIPTGAIKASAANCAGFERGPASIALQRPVTGDDTEPSAGFGMRTHPILGAARLHTGVDWTAPLGTAVVAAVRGRVTAAGTEGPYGKRVIVDHGASYQTMYAQLGTITVAVGDCVAAGDLIGTVGVSGLTTHPHLHFEVRHKGQPIDPVSLSWVRP